MSDLPLPKVRSEIDEFPLTIRSQGKRRIVIVRALPSTESKPDRSPMFRGEVVGELEEWLALNGKKRVGKS